MKLATLGPGKSVRPIVGAAFDTIDIEAASGIKAVVPEFRKSAEPWLVPKALNGSQRRATGGVGADNQNLLATAAERAQVEQRVDVRHVP